MDNILSIYFTAGFPMLDNTREIIVELSNNGVDIIEIGIPFSDPLADGPVIQASNEKALENGMTLSVLFQQLADIRAYTSSSLVLMSYLNPVLQFGMEQFLQKAVECGIDGVIIPDLPVSEYMRNYKSLFDKFRLTMIFLITPQTSKERIREIDELSNGFIYMVTMDTTTGYDKDFKSSHLAYFDSIKKLQLKNPILAGFGIRSKSNFLTICKYVNGGIIGSEFIRYIEDKSDLSSSVKTFIKTFEYDHSVKG